MVQLRYKIRKHRRRAAINNMLHELNILGGNMKIISIDHGNRLIKTPSVVFPASYGDTSKLPDIANDTLIFEGREYALTDQRKPVMMDKTENDDYFILTLFALGKELRPNDLVQYVDLLVGLPLQHYKEYKARFEMYFKRSKGMYENISFMYNGSKYSIKINTVNAYPQAHSAALTVASKISESRIVNIIDIGGYTVDCLQMDNFSPNMELCTSLYLGVNTMFDAVNKKVRAGGKKEIPDKIIEGILSNDLSILKDSSEGRIQVVQEVAQEHANKIIAEVAQQGFDLEEDKTVFMGGGAILLQKYIIMSGKVKKPVFLTDVQANAKGYMLRHELERNKKGHG